MLNIYIEIELHYKMPYHTQQSQIIKLYIYPQLCNIYCTFCKT